MMNINRFLSVKGLTCLFTQVVLGGYLVAISGANIAQGQVIEPFILPEPPNRPLPWPNQSNQQRSIPTLNNNNSSTGNFSTSGLYRVEINGSSSSLLQRVRNIEPGAFIRRREGVIQAGVFQQQIRAQIRAQELVNNGINAKVIDVNNRQVVEDSNNQTLPTNGTITFGQSSFSNNSTFSNNNTVNSNPLPNPTVSTGIVNNPAPRDRDNSYFVIIPGKPEDLPNVNNQLVSAGINPQLIRQREAPLGPHLLIGPFVNRDLANEWERSLRGAGWDARVHYGK